MEDIIDGVIFAVTRISIAMEIFRISPVYLPIISTSEIIGKLKCGY